MLVAADACSSSRPAVARAALLGRQLVRERERELLCTSRYEVARAALLGLLLVCVFVCV